jgi:hypothetical protein
MARMAELVDAPDLGSGSERSGGSSPLPRTVPGRRLAGFFVCISVAPHLARGASAPDASEDHSASAAGQKPWTQSASQRRVRSVRSARDARA